MRHTVSQVLTELQKHGLLVEADLKRLLPSSSVEGLSYDNRVLKKGELFVCKGAAFRKEYLTRAIDAGAVLYLSETLWDNDFPHVIVSDIRLSMALLGKLFFYEEAKSLTLIAVTGTKGKTTTVSFLNRILDSYHLFYSKRRTALLSSLSLYDGTVEEEAKLTTPEAIDLWRHLATAGKNRLGYALCEVSSQALKYHRTTGIDFKVAVFLNIGEDHISDVEHTDFEDYFSSKLKIFDSAKIACINSSCDFFEEIVAYAASKGCEIVTFGFKPGDSLVCESVNFRFDETEFSVLWQNGPEESYRISMKGKHNLENALAALAVSKILGIPSEFLHEGLFSTSVEGRGEHLTTNDGSITAIIDYAHNRMSMEALFSYVSKAFPNKKITTVFGCPGGKARNRRRDMGLISGEYSDHVIITEDDPANEPLDVICKEVLSYVERMDTVASIVFDRGQAIREAFRSLPEGGVILVCGKGAERTQRRKNGLVFYETDKYFVTQCIEEYNKSAAKLFQ